MHFTKAKKDLIALIGFIWLVFTLTLMSSLLVSLFKSLFAADVQPENHLSLFISPGYPKDKNGNNLYGQVSADHTPVAHTPVVLHLLNDEGQIIDQLAAGFTDGTGKFNISNLSFKNDQSSWWLLETGARNTNTSLKALVTSNELNVNRTTTAIAEIILPLVNSPDYPFLSNFTPEKINILTNQATEALATVDLRQYPQGELTELVLKNIGSLLPNMLQNNDNQSTREFFSLKEQENILENEPEDVRSALPPTYLANLPGKNMLNLSDGLNYPWMISSNSLLKNDDFSYPELKISYIDKQGNENNCLFSHDYELNLDNSPYLEDEREIVFGPLKCGELEIWRKLYVPNQAGYGFVRYLERISNTSKNQDISFSYQINYDLRAPYQALKYPGYTIHYAENNPLLLGSLHPEIASLNTPITKTVSRLQNATLIHFVFIKMLDQAETPAFNENLTNFQGSLQKLSKFLEPLYFQNLSLQEIKNSPYRFSKLVKVEGRAGSVPPLTAVLITNKRSGLEITTTSKADGRFQGLIAAEKNDTLRISTTYGDYHELIFQ